MGTQWIASRAAALALLVVPAAAMAVPPAGLVGQWSAELNALDSSPNANHGSFAGRFVSGHDGYAFDLQNGSVTIADHAAYAIGAAFSTAFWFNLNGQPSGVFLGQDEGSGPFPKWFIEYNLNQPKGFSVYTYGADEALLSSAPVQLNPAWNHFALVKDGADFGFFLNGTRVSTQSFSGTFSDPAADLSFGYLEPGHQFAGLLDEVLLYQRALTDSEVLALVPEPGTALLAALGVALLGLRLARVKPR